MTFCHNASCSLMNDLDQVLFPFKFANFHICERTSCGKHIFYFSCSLLLFSSSFFTSHYLLNGYLNAWLVQCFEFQLFAMRFHIIECINTSIYFIDVFKLSLAHPLWLFACLFGHTSFSLFHSTLITCL